MLINFHNQSMNSNGTLLLLVSLLCLFQQLGLSEPTNGRVWEPTHAKRDKPDAQIQQVTLNSALIAQLPEPFDISKLPKMIQAEPEDGEQIRFNHIGVVDMLSNRQPDDPFSLGTKFHIYNGTRKRIIKYELFKNCLKPKAPGSELQCVKIPFNLSEMLDIFDPKKRTVIIIGGFLMKATSDWQLKMADKWLRIEDVNVIIVSWNKGNRLLYSKSVSNTKVVARQTVVLLYYLAKLHNLDPGEPDFADNIVLIGHSLGAHIAGFIGQDFGGKLGRITGLDPAGPSFSHSHESHRLDRNDAQFVDVIHTNADFGIQVFLGIYTQVGHVDYYANDGKWQPNCRLSPNFLQCNHGAVIDYYNSILDHELSMRSYVHYPESRDSYRIVAYRAKSFNQFRNGKTMFKNCPKMALDGDESPSHQSGVDDFNACGIPIDFIKRPKLIRQELEQVYNINFGPTFKPTEKYWFFTSHKMPFVVEHNLLKLHYDVPRSDLYDIRLKQCSLSMTYTMLDGEKSTREVPKFRPQLDGTEHPHTTIPFVNHNLDGRYLLIDLDSTHYYNSNSKSKGANSFMSDDEQIISHAYGIFPAKIEIDTEPVDESDKSILSRISRWFTDDPMDGVSKSEKRKMCSYNVKTVRLQPLRKTNRLFMVLYSSKADLPGENAHGKRGESFKPRVVRLKEGESVPDVEMPGSKTNPTVYLDTIVIGPSADDSDDDYELVSADDTNGVIVEAKPDHRLTDHQRTPYEEAVVIGIQYPLYSREYKRHPVDLTKLRRQKDSPYAIDQSNYDFSSLG